MDVPQSLCKGIAAINCSLGVPESNSSGTTAGSGVRHSLHHKSDWVAVKLPSSLLQDSLLLAVNNSTKVMAAAA